jgi:dTDP-4-amino-4,6-dideoxygalactose transaminase
MNENDPPIPVPMANLPAQYARLKPELDAAVIAALDGGAFVLGTTPSANAVVERLERDVAAFCGARHGIAVNSGTDALLLSLMALGVGPGDEVITPPFTFVATVETVALLGATPVFADIDPVTFNLCPDRVAEKITPRTRAILPVHLFGQMADMGALSRIAADHGLPLIGDAAQAIGSEHRGRPVAQWSTLTTLSFYPTKNLGAAGDGGMVLTGDEALADKLRYLRFHGSKGTYQYRYVGICSRLDALQAAILSVKLPHLEAWNERRRANAAFYDRALADLPGLVLPRTLPGNVHTYHQYTLRVTGGRRDALKAHLASCGVASGIFYPAPLHLEEAYRNLGGRPGDFPHAEQACREVLSLPIMPELTGVQRAHVADSVREFFGG